MTRVKIKPAEIVTLEDGFKYYWPENTRSGCYSAANLRDIADQLDLMNEEWEEQIRKDLSRIERK